MGVRSEVDSILLDADDEYVGSLSPSFTEVQGGDAGAWTRERAASPGKGALEMLQQYYSLVMGQQQQNQQSAPDADSTYGGRGYQSVISPVTSYLGGAMNVDHDMGAQPRGLQCSPQEISQQVQGSTHYQTGSGSWAPSWYNLHPNFEALQGNQQMHASQDYIRRVDVSQRADLPQRLQGSRTQGSGLFASFQSHEGGYAYFGGSHNGLTNSQAALTQEEIWRDFMVGYQPT